MVESYGTYLFLASDLDVVEKSGESLIWAGVTNTNRPHTQNAQVGPLGTTTTVTRTPSAQVLYLYIHN